MNAVTAIRGNKELPSAAQINERAVLPVTITGVCFFEGKVGYYVKLLDGRLIEVDSVCVQTSEPQPTTPATATP